MIYDLAVTESADRIVDTARGTISYGDYGRGPARVVLHSLLTDRRAFDHLRADMGGRIITVDLAGFGSTAPAPPTIDAYADQVAALMEALDLEPTTTFLMGNGLGAFVALGLAIHHGDAFGRLLLIGCGTGFSASARGSFLAMASAAEAGGMDAVVPTALRRIFTEEYLDANPSVAEERAMVLKRTDPAAFASACHALYGLDYAEEVSGVHNPTMIVVGEDDRATPPEMAERLHALLPDSTLVRLSGVAHAPHLQDPAGFMRTIKRFLEE
ncbi:MAG: alpha/beta hydrolase [Acidimicrobiia bacterium]